MSSLCLLISFDVLVEILAVNWRWILFFECMYLYLSWMVLLKPCCNIVSKVQIADDRRA